MLSFRAFGIPVTIGPAIVGGLLFLGVLSSLGGIFLVAWIGLGIVALLAHELGHALTFRRFGVASSIQFFVLGGLTVPEPAAAGELSDKRLTLVALAGPFVSLLIGLLSLAVVVVLAQLGASGPAGTRTMLFIWLFVNLGWGVFNLLPIGGLDGGQALRHLFGALVPGRVGVVIGIGSTLVGALLVVAFALAMGQPYLAFMAILFGLANPGLYAELLGALMPRRSATSAER